MGGRARAALRKAEKIEAQWGSGADRSWMKHARCSVCRRRFVVNNFPDKHPRPSQYKVAGRWLCPNCQGREGKYVVQLRILAERSVEMADGHCGGDDRDCKCIGHVAKRILAAHDEKRP